MKFYDPTGFRSLRWLHLWRSLGWLMVLAVWLLSLSPQAVSAPGGDKLHHFIAYFGLTLLFCQWHRSERHWLIALTFAGMGIAIELIQPLSGRYFSWLDMLANVSGVLLAWWLGSGWAGQILQRLESGKLL
jgi:VanZ family protein